ncbi:hypothetical protein P7K49_009724 [Saguinus oedipus]|uniref:Uncharacterized protein n=1 Tax=Saguinus oedipus TaxID=9490 RepID=A0ABQ9VKS7_SAGOE|nr:hypothetical protein P7K49_009724 [Saguinus oedipus]
MSMWTSPRRLVDLAGQSLLKNEALAIAVLELLPREFFPPLLRAAFDGRHNQTLKAMVQAWPFTCLPLGVLMKGQQLHVETFKAVLDGVDVLLAQELETQSAGCRKEFSSRLLDHMVWNRGQSVLISRARSSSAHEKEVKVDGSSTEAEQPFTPIEVLVDLSLKEGAYDELFTHLIEIVRRKKDVLHLCCKKLKIFCNACAEYQDDPENGAAGLY